MGIKFLGSVPDDARNALIEIAKNDVVKDASFLDGNVVFLDADGNPKRDDEYNKVTMEVRLKEKLKSIIDEGRQQPGVKIKDPVIKKNEKGDIDVTISIPDTVQTMADLIDHLPKAGIARNSAEYYPTLEKYSQELGLEIK